MNGVPHNEDGASGMHLYMPWWLDNRTLDFPRGYHIEIGGGRRMPSAGFLSGIHRFTRRRRLRAARSPPAATARPSRTTTAASTARRSASAGRGEMIPNEQSYCEIDPTVVDRWGIPVLRFHFKWTRPRDTTRCGTCRRPSAPSSTRWAARRCRRCRSRERGYGIEPGGRIIHEVGVHAHGALADHLGAERALPGARRASNLFVADGGPFVTNADKNVTWTILALAMRTSEYIADERKAGTAVMAGLRSSADCCGCWQPRRWPPASRGRGARSQRRTTLAQAARQQPPSRRQAGAVHSRSSSPRTSGETVRVLVDLIIPARRAIGQRHRRRRARVHGLHHDRRGTEAARGSRAPDRDARRTGLARPRMPAPLRQDVRGLPRRSNAPPCSTTSRTSLPLLPEPGDPVRSTRRQRSRPVARPRVLQQLPRSDRNRLLDDEDGDRGPAVHGQPLRGGVERLPDEALKRLGVSYPAE